MALDVRVDIKSVRPINKAGFGIPLVLEGKATAEIAYKECSNLDEVVQAGFASTTAVYKAAELIFMQDNAPEKVAVCATTTTVKDWMTVENLGRNWRQLVVTSFETNEESNIADVMAAIETTENKMFFASLNPDDDTVLTVSGIERTVLFYVKKTDTVKNPEAALVGAAAGRAVGSFTYKNLILKGLEAQILTDSEIEAIHAKGGITFVTKAGDAVTSEGKTAGGEYIDLVDSKDYVINEIEYQTQKTLNNNDKIPYDNNGIAMLESVCINVMKDAYGNGIIATNADGSPGYTVNYALREETLDTDRSARRYVGGKFSFILAGAIHEVKIEGELSI